MLDPSLRETFYFLLFPVTTARGFGKVHSSTYRTLWYVLRWPSFLDLLGWNKLNTSNSKTIGKCCLWFSWFCRYADIWLSLKLHFQTSLVVTRWHFNPFVLLHILFYLLYIECDKSLVRGDLFVLIAPKSSVWFHLSGESGVSIRLTEWNRDNPDQLWES